MGSFRELPVFAGTSHPPRHGAVARVRVEYDAGESHPDETRPFERSGATTYRVVPFLRLLGEHGARTLVVGRLRIAAAGAGLPALTLVLCAAWSERHAWTQVPEIGPRAEELLAASLAEPAHPVSGDERSVVAVLAKAAAESSHNEVSRVRGLCYELERRFADQLASRRREAMRPLLAEIVELSIALNRARDQARAARRDGLWLWLGDEEAYRRSRAESAPGPEAPVPARMHHLALRHVDSLDVLLDEEVARLQRLLQSMSTIAVAQDAEAQQNFNVAAAATAAGLGLPALILSFYGAQAFLPLDTLDRAWRALLPIGATALLAIFVALRRLPWRARPMHYLAGALLVALLVGMLWVAGALVPTAPR